MNETPSAAKQLESQPHSRESGALMIIDVQRGFDRPEHWGSRNNLDAEDRIASLLDVWRTAARPVVHVQHLSSEPGSPLQPGQPGVEFKPVVHPLPGEEIVQKRVNSAFIGTELDGYLRDQGIRTLVIAELTTDHCVSTTARMAGNLGYTTYVVQDATATFERRDPDGKHYSAELMHDTALASLHGEFAQVVRTEWLLEGS